MSNGNTPRDDAELENFLGRRSPLSTAYDAIEPVQPPEVLDAKILAIAKAAASPPSAKPAPTQAAPAPKPVAASGPPPAAKARPMRPPDPARDDDGDDEHDTPPARRPRWLVPAALAASVLVAVGVGVAMLGTGPADDLADPGAAKAPGSLFAKRARERSEADKATAETAAAASQEAEVEIAPLPPPPIFEPEGPQVEDLDKAIALIRRELVLANQRAAMAEDAPAGAADPRAGAAALAAPSAPPADAASATGVIQPRDRRLTKILELYDGGNTDLAADSLEIFLRDFEDDPISQRILAAQPRATDVAVE
ncbi:MAG: hypothetical protein JNK40_10740 [Chromatiales bacterium]|nr:hypothetical protein [Chromatiales bacterium]